MVKNIKLIIWIILFIMLIIWNHYYEYYKYDKHVTKEELEKRKIDEYNFWQLEIVKTFFSYQNEYKFRDLQDFNKKYTQNIKPIKNCYYLVSTNYFEKYNWYSQYIFWFELYSDKYRDKYWESDKSWRYYYAYPKYDLPYHKVCFWTKESCTDLNFGHFMRTITHPCQD